MKDKAAVDLEKTVWCFPGWARAAGFIIIALGIIDYLQIDSDTFLPLSFFLAMAGVVVADRNIVRARQQRLEWLIGGYYGWALLNLLAVMLLFMTPGMLRRNLVEMSFRAPCWIIFGAWFAWYAHRIEKTRRCSAAVSGLISTENARALFRFSLVWLALYLLVSVQPIAHFEPSAGQKVTIWPLQAEFMAQRDSETWVGVLGLPAVQEKMDQVLAAGSESMPLLGMLWFPLQILVIPMAWFFTGRNRWGWLSLVTALGVIALISIPAQLCIQFGLTISGPAGFLRPGYLFLWVPVVAQILALLSVLRAAGTLKARNVAAELSGGPINELGTIARPPFAGAVIAAVIMTALMPALTRSAIESLMLAAAKKQPEKFEVYLEKVKKEVPVAGLETALCEAIDRDHIGLVDWLLTFKPDLNSAPPAKGHPPLYWALRGDGNLPITELLLKAGANPNQQLGSSHWDTPLGLVLWLNYRKDEGLRFVRLLASYGADLNIPANHEGHFPIEVAIRRSYSAGKTIVPELIRLGADPLKTSGDNLFYLVLLKRDAELLKTMMAAGLSHEATDRMGNNFLHIWVRDQNLSARDCDHYSFKSYLEDVINDRNEEGKTPLHLAVEKNHPGSVEALLSWHANPDLPDHQGLTPRRLAENKRFLRLLKIMETPHGEGK